MLLILCCLTAAALADERVIHHVYFHGEREMFPEELDALHLYVAPLMGADCLLLTCGGEAMLVDVGKANDYPAVKAMLEKQSIRKLKYVFNTHPHTDHIGGWKQLIRDYPVGALITVFPENFTSKEAVQKPAVKAAKEAGIEILSMGDEDTFTLGDARFTVYQQSRYKNDNYRSGMLLVTFGERRLLLAGDCNGLGGKLLAETKDLHADILKFPHHGIGYTYAEFVEAVHPEFAIITHGYANTKRNQGLLQKYHASFGFATWGTIHAATDGTCWIVEQELTEDGARYMKRYGGKNGVWE